MSSSRLASYLEVNAHRICERYAEHLRHGTAAASLDHRSVIDDLGELLREIASVLRGADAPKVSSATARAHGRQRFEIGYDARALVDEYGALFDLLFAMLVADGEKVDPAEVQVLGSLLLGAAAEAIARYAESRDAQLEQQASRYVSFLAHELRNPLASVRLAVSLLVARGAVPPSRALSSIERGLSSMNRLIDDALLELRIRGSETIEHAPFDLATLLDELAHEASSEIEAKGLQVTIDAAHPITLDGDRRLIRSALSNLIRNAIKFSHSGGEVGLRARAADDRIVVEVEDSCGGLPEGAVEKIFDPYVQLGKDRSGFGLGLAISKQVAQAHHGEIRVHDLPGKGCVFLLDLPARAGDPALETT